jgi:hypothetical protein
MTRPSFASTGNIVAGSETIASSEFKEMRDGLRQGKSSLYTTRLLAVRPHSAQDSQYAGASMQQPAEVRISLPIEVDTAYTVTIQRATIPERSARPLTADAELWSRCATNPHLFYVRKEPLSYTSKLYLYSYEVRWIVLYTKSLLNP